MKAWKRVIVDPCDSDPVKFAQKADEQGIQLTHWAREILARCNERQSTEPRSLSLALTTVRELGFPEGARYGAICEVAQSLGLQLCPTEVGPALRLAYRCQPQDDWLMIAMTPLLATDDEGGECDLSILELKRTEHSCQLDAFYGDPAFYYPAYVRFVFVLGEKPTFTCPAL